MTLVFSWMDESLTFFSNNGIIYFSLHRDILYEKVLTYSCQEIISFGNILILTSLGNKVYAETTVANMRDRVITECNKITPDTLHNASELLIYRYRRCRSRHIELFL